VVYRYYTGNSPGVLLRVLFDEVDVYSDESIIETLQFGELLITLPDSSNGTDRWGWYGDKYEYIRIVTPSGRTGSILRANIGKVEEDGD